MSDKIKRIAIARGNCLRVAIGNAFDAVVFEGALLSENDARTYTCAVHIFDMKHVKDMDTQTLDVGSLEWNSFAIDIPYIDFESPTGTLRIDKCRGKILRVLFRAPGSFDPIAECYLLISPPKLRVTKLRFFDLRREDNSKEKEFRSDETIPLVCSFNRELFTDEKIKVRLRLYYDSTGLNPNADTQYKNIQDLDLEYGSEPFVKIKLKERIAGIRVALSAFFNSPVDPNTNSNAETIRYVNLFSHKKVKAVKSVYWSVEEKIAFDKQSTVREEICRNEDGFLHIHTQGMFGHWVDVLFHERDMLGTKKLPICQCRNVVIADNCCCVGLSMREVERYARKYRMEMLEQGDFEIIAEVIPRDGNIASVKSNILLLNFNKEAEKPARSTVNGVMKGVIGVGKEKEKNANDTKKDKCPNCDKDITLEEIKRICADKNGKCLIKNDVMIIAALPYLNEYRKKVGINSCLTKAHFLAQISQETKFYRLQEGFRYTNSERMRKLFYSYFRQFGSLENQKKEAKRLSDLSLDSKNWPEVANAIYGKTHPNGKNHTDKHDGWRYSGKGYKQITWKDNYLSLQPIAQEISGSHVAWVDNDNPYKLKDNQRDAILSALAYWKKKKINDVATGLSNDDVDNVTSRINTSKSKDIVEPRRFFFARAVEVLKVEECLKKECTKEKNTISTYDGKHKAEKNEAYINVITTAERNVQGPLVVFDETGVLFVTHSLCRGANANRLKASGNGDTPTGRATTRYNPNAHKGEYSYGNHGLIYLVGESGEFLQATKNGRDGIAIHAGHTSGYYKKSLKDIGNLMGTYGCVRVYNDEMKKLGALYSQLKRQGKTIYCYIEDYNGDIEDVYKYYGIEKDAKDKLRSKRSKKQ